VAASVRYEVEGWGVGELWLDGETLLWHELPSKSATEGGDDPSNELAVRLRAYFTGARDSFADVKIDLDGYTEFQRAAGSVCAGNRFPLVVPCHRVVAANGIGRYGARGVGYKRRLLELEGVTL